MTVLHSRLAGSSAPALWRSMLWLLALMCVWTGAAGQAPASDFDHLRTGFALTGAHANSRCESCHIGGVFKGTPRLCEACHVSGARYAKANVVKTVDHIPTVQACETCHNTRSFVGARMNHANVVKGTCASCHNGAQAAGKGASHPRTSASCDNCHGPAAWRPAMGMDHAGVSPGSCATCHNGTQATGRGANHVPHMQVAATANAGCDTCHKAGFKSWTPAKLHSSVSVSTQCATCHVALKPNTVIHAGQTVCETCHKATASWSSGRVDHSTYTAATDCTGCHNGSAATGKHATHIPAGTSNCASCHSTTGWKPTRFNHTQVSVTAQCASCHTGAFAPADGKPANHTPYQLIAASASANCDACHKAGFTAWTPAKLHASVAVSTQCATCHAALKPNNAVHAGQTVCETCHKSTASWSAARVDHSTYTAATDCTGCHNGSAATGKHATHIPVGASNCVGCHATTGWKPTRFNHTQVPVTAQCASCHTGTFAPAVGKPANHIPYQLIAASASANCDTCHKAGYTAWTPAKFHLNVTVATQCATCHAAIKPSTPIHAGQTVCETCHRSTTTWAGARVDHSTFTAATDCTTCHNGISASGKNATHVPVGTTNCVSCHTTTGWRPSRFNHTQVAVAAQCASCHTGTFPPAVGKPANHPPYQLIAASASANCDACHKAGFTAWTPAKFHLNVAVTTQCSTCHAAIKPNTPIHSGQTVCETCHRSTTSWAGARVDHSTFTAATNCTTCHNGISASGKNATHIPVGATNCISCHTTTAWRPSRFNHTQVPVTAQCATCHTGTFPPAVGKPANHTPYQLIAASASANCDTCHKSGFTAWTPARFHLNVAVTTQCATCHASIKPNTPIHVAQTVCETCHRSTTTWAGARVDHSTFTAATNCTTCHNGISASGKNATHIPVGATNCISCHTTTAWRPSRFNHTQVPVTAQCASCHSGAFPPADGKPAGHIPYQLITAAATANCDTCHRGSYTTWANGRLHAYVTVTGQCKTCHNGSYLSQGAVAKTANHIPETQLLNGAAMECNACHTTTTSWSQRMNHNNSLGGGAGWCKGCHLRGLNYSGGGETKSLTHKTKTPPAIDCSEAGCHRPLGSKGATYTRWD